MNLAPKKEVVNGERGIWNFEYIHRIVHPSPRSILEHFYYLKKTSLPAKVRLVKAMVFPVAMYGCESWTIKKAEHQKIDAFELCCWRRLLRVPWTARRSTSHPKGDQSWMFIGGSDVEAETPIFLPPDAKSWLIWKDGGCHFMSASVAVLLRGPFHGDRVQYKFGVLEPNN